MTEHSNQLIIDGKLVVSKVVNVGGKGSRHGEETFTVTFEDGSTREITHAELRRAEEANTEED
jgi:hypothetical protein